MFLQNKVCFINLTVTLWHSFLINQTNRMSSLKKLYEEKESNQIEMEWMDHNIWFLILKRKIN